MLGRAAPTLVEHILATPGQVLMAVKWDPTVQRVCKSGACWEGAGSCWGVLGGCWGMLGCCWRFWGEVGRCWGVLRGVGGCQAAHPGPWHSVGSAQALPRCSAIAPEPDVGTGAPMSPA
ncbi:unnamed protein product [Coccothraustes coccothraustes]